jgi:putative colanic acid biosynthesis UDP-glucose lipid carrier transferase
MNTAPLALRQTVKLVVGPENILAVIEITISPLLIVLTLWGIALYQTGELTAPYLLLSVVVFAMTFPGARLIDLGIGRAAIRIATDWLGIAALMVFFGYASRYLDVFDRGVILTWLWFAPASLFAAQMVLRFTAPSMINLQGGEKRIVIAGMNEHGTRLARLVAANPYFAMRTVGFFDDRSSKRLAAADEFPLLGLLKELPAFVKANDINVIYLSLPMATQPRILDLLDSLRDTTASIYFVPDIFVTDLIQGRIDAVGEIPVVAVCETPFTGVNGLLKRVSDIVLAALILMLISPLLIGLAIAVKATSPGPIIFRQRRYGLDGKDIVVYKFRSMTVCEDGEQIRQAQKNDNRLTPLGAFMRRTSLDELPQFLNVLQGRMSIVGPRPHAVAHNEQYRKLIRGYMIRHKVKPGITGWAQVNGYRGETDTLDKMQKRIEYDLDYLRNWSLRLDLQIIAGTVLVVLKDRNAY